MQQLFFSSDTSRKGYGFRGLLNLYFPKTPSLPDSCIKMLEKTSKKLTKTRGASPTLTLDDIKIKSQAL